MQKTIRTHPRYHWLIDKKSLGPNVQSRYVVCWLGESAGATFEGVPVGSIFSIDRITNRTGLAGMFRINKNYRNPPTFGLIFDKTFQLVETPVVQPCSPGLSGLNAFTDVLKIFKGNCKARAFSLSHDCFGNAVIYVFLKTTLLARNSFELSLGGTRTYFLKLLTLPCHAFSVFFNTFARIASTLRINGKIDNAEINTKNIFRVDKVVFINIACAGNIKNALNQHQINFTLSGFKKLSLIITALKRYLLPAVKGPNRNQITCHHTKDSIVIRLRRMLLENSLFFFVKLVSIGNLGNAANSHLSRKVKLGLNVIVGSFVQFKLTKFFILPGELRNIVAGLIRGFKGSFQKLILFRRWI